jgi:N-[(2S)-2-amino-2-carboxyethyl]-L-glutamate dehydrogenase
MPEGASTPEFYVISGKQVHDVLRDRRREVIALVEQTYRAHGGGNTVNPPSYFLNFPDRPTSRIIALPASIGGAGAVHGVKWISSFPENTAAGLPRASAVLVLNDPETGYPLACLESSIISAARTAASAALAADVLSRDRGRPTRLGIIGTGLIARYIHGYLTDAGWSFDETGIYDTSPASAAGFQQYLERSGASGTVASYGRPEDLISRSDLVVFATVAGHPHVHEPAWFGHNPLVLHVSLRDLSPEVILASANIVDDVEHCLRANTSVHLTEQREGNRKFLDGTLYDVLTGASSPPADRPLVFSPFGLGVLDLALGRYVYDELRRSGQGVAVNDFFFELSRHGSLS